jgi:S1-C subfamily serine protease
MVPVPIIKHFLKDISDGKYDGFPEVGLLTQTMENPDIRRRYKMTDDKTGVLVAKVLLGSPAEGKIEPGDILLAIDGHPIADDGTVEFRDKERTNFAYYVDQHQLGDKLEFDVLHNGKVKKVSFILDSTQEKFWLVPREQYDRLPRYFIYGGIVFTPLTKNLIQAWGPDWFKEAPIELVAELSNWRTEDREEIVVALKVLAADMNKGYHNLRNAIITEVNGRKFKNFNEFFNLVINSTAPFIEFKEKKDYQIVLDRIKAEQENQAILETYRIKEDRSPDLVR